jgi:peptidyl-prolyl cis-trans isomerase C
MSFSPPYFRERLKQNPEQKVIIVKKIMEHKIIADLARKEGLDKHEDVQVQLKYMVNDLLFREFTIRNIMDKVTVTEEDAKKYYENNNEKFIIPEQVRARHILIKIPFGASEEESKQAEEKANNVLEWLKKGEKFENLSEQYSEDETSAKKGGDLGYIPKGRMAKAFEDAAFSMKPGEISQPVRTSLGFHIIKLEDRKEEEKKSFEEVKDSITPQLENEKKQFEVQAFIQKAAEDAGLEMNEDIILGTVKK